MKYMYCGFTITAFPLLYYSNRLVNNVVCIFSTTIYDKMYLSNRIKNQLAALKNYENCFTKYCEGLERGEV